MIGAGMSGLGFGSLQWTVKFDRYLFPKPYREKETFSGGRNLSATERNKARKAEASQVMIHYPSKTIIVPKWLEDEFREAVRTTPMSALEVGEMIHRAHVEKIERRPAPKMVWVDEVAEFGAVLNTNKELTE
jgi:hypothetical protein